MQAILQFVLLLLIAGNETTTNLIGNAIVALLRNPDQLELVAAEPELIPNLVEETLRYDTPVQFIARRATRDVEIAGARIPANGRVVVLIGSANRDERQFDDPDDFDLTRDTKGHVNPCAGDAAASTDRTMPANLTAGTQGTWLGRCIDFRVAQ